MKAIGLTSFRREFSKYLKKKFFDITKKPDLGACHLVEPGEVSPERPVPDRIPKPDYYFERSGPGRTLGKVEIKNAEQILAMRKSGKLAANVLATCGEFIKVNTTTDQIDALVHQLIIAQNAYPSPLRYAGYPKSVCTSVNNVACHGIPDDRPLKDGDIINVDVSVYFEGYHGDCSKTFLVGNVDERGRYLVNSVQECLNLCIAACKPNENFNTIGRLITDYCNKKQLAPVPAFTGHGIGSYFHGPPEILHYYNSNPGKMLPGMTFTIEPILSLGSPELELHPDGWTATTVDGARTAQFEHTILITDNGAEVLTQPD